jgi:hypothetical protein
MMTAKSLEDDAMAGRVLTLRLSVQMDAEFAAYVASLPEGSDTRDAVVAKRLIAEALELHEMVAAANGGHAEPIHDERSPTTEEWIRPPELTEEQNIACYEVFRTELGRLLYPAEAAIVRRYPWFVLCPRAAQRLDRLFRAAESQGVRRNTAEVRRAIGKARRFSQQMARKSDSLQAADLGIVSIRRAGFTGDACSTPADRRRPRPSAPSDQRSRPGTPAPMVPTWRSSRAFGDPPAQGFRRPRLTRVVADGAWRSTQHCRRSRDI